MWLFTIFIVALLYIYIKVRQSLRYWPKKGIKYVKPLPIMGNMYPMMAKTETTGEFIQNLYKVFPEERYCGVMQLTTPILLVRDPDLIRQITVKNFEHFVDHTSAFTVDSDRLWSRTLIATKGNRWRDLRHTISPVFTASKIKVMFALIKECGAQLVHHLKQEGITDVEMKDMCEKYAGDVIATSAFGIQYDSFKFPDNEFLKAGRELADYTGVKKFKFLLFGYFPRLCKLLKMKVVSSQVANIFESIIMNTIKERQQNNITRPDLIHLLTEARKGQLKNDNNESTESTSVPSKSLYLSDDDILAQSVIFYLAGFDTTSSIMCAACHELATNPHVQDRLREEITSTLNEYDGKFTYERLMKMKYLDMVLNETLRKWPQASWLDRICTKPFVIEPQRPGEKPLRLEVGDDVWIPAYALQRDPKYFPDPDLFDPERFSDDNKSKITPGTFLAFGAGPRECVGARFGTLSIKIFLFSILSNFEIVPNDRTMIPLKLSKESFFFMVDGGCQLSLKPIS